MKRERQTYKRFQNDRWKGRDKKKRYRLTKTPTSYIYFVDEVNRLGWF